MSIRTSLSTRDEYISACESVNRKVVDRVKRTTGINPRTRVVGYHDTFAVDMSTGDIYVARVDPSVVEGYLTHENGHRSAFPVTSAGTIAFTIAVKSLVSSADDASVMSATNVVSDAFSDTILLHLGLGKQLAKRVGDFLSKLNYLDPLMAFKSLVYKSIEIAASEGKDRIPLETVGRAKDELAKLFPHGARTLDRVFATTVEFVKRTEELLKYTHPPKVSSFFLNPFVEIPPTLSYLANTAAELLRMEQEVPPPSGGECKSGGASGQSQRQSSSKGGSKGRAGGNSGGEGTERKVDIERGDIEPGEIDPMDVHRAITIAQKGFGTDVWNAAVYIDLLYSEKIRRSVQKLIERIRLLYVHQDRAEHEPSGFKKKRTDLWIQPYGEPDEDSVLKEKHKLLWKVEYKVPHRRGKLFRSPAEVPEKAVLVMDESGSTLDPFGQANVISVEALVLLLVAAGLRYKGGAKEISVVKFSSWVEKVYRGGDLVEACSKVIVPHKRAGAGTNIIEAVRVGISEATKNSALVVVTDLVISEVDAEKIGKMLKTATESGKVGFTVFVVVNAKKNEAVLDIIRRELSGRNFVVAHVSSADDLENLGNTIIGRIIRMGRGE